MKPNLFQELSPREGDGLVLAFELVATTMLMAGLGWLLDRALGTGPVLAVVLGGFTFAYEVWKLATGYSAELDRQLDARTPLRRGSDR